MGRRAASTARLFDNVEDNLTFARFQTFDFEGMDKIPQVLEPLLFYILHRANAAIYDPALATTFKVFVMDEAWRFFRHPDDQALHPEALKTWRKKNAAMILATQSSDDLVALRRCLPVVVESCPTKMFLANPGMDPRGLPRALSSERDRSADSSRGSFPNSRFLRQAAGPGQGRQPQRRPQRTIGSTPTTPMTTRRRREAFERYGFEEGLEILARRQLHEIRLAVICIRPRGARVQLGRRAQAVPKPPAPQSAPESVTKS